MFVDRFLSLNGGVTIRPGDTKDTLFFRCAETEKNSLRKSMK